MFSKQIMWQSWVENEHYSVTYFDCVTAFEALQQRIALNPTFNRSSEIQHFKCGDVIKIQ